MKMRKTNISKFFYKKPVQHVFHYFDSTAAKNGARIRITLSLRFAGLNRLFASI